MAWRAAPCILTMRDEANTLAPNRSKASDGIVGDTSHQARPSDHNPDSRGIVHAIDITHDPAHGWDAHARVRQVKTDPRFKYGISQRKIFSYYSVGSYPPYAERPYGGSSPHEKHAHTSIRSGVQFENDTRPWWPEGQEDEVTDEDLQKLTNMVNGVVAAQLGPVHDEIETITEMLGPDYGDIGKALFTLRRDAQGNPVFGPDGKKIYDETTEILRDQVSELSNRIGGLEADVAAILNKLNEGDGG